MLQELGEMLKELKENNEELGNLIDDGLIVLSNFLGKIPDNPETKQIATNVAKLTRLMYDSFFAEGFDSNQATAFTAAILGKGKK